MATKKSAAAAKPAKKAPATRSGSVKDRNDQIIPKIVEMRDGGAKWNEIVEKFGISTMGKAILLYEYGKVKKADRITGTESEVGKAIVRAREQEKLSWGKIMARTGLGQATCKSLYVRFAKDPERGARIGKGGRWPEGKAPAKPTAKATKATPAKKAAKATAATPISKGKELKAKKAKADTAATAKKAKARKRIAVNPGTADTGGDEF